MRNYLKADHVLERGSGKMIKGHVWSRGARLLSYGALAAVLAGLAACTGQPGSGKPTKDANGASANHPNSTRN